MARKPETICIQAGWTPKKGEPRVLPICQSTTFKYESSEQIRELVSCTLQAIHTDSSQMNSCWRLAYSRI